jgi:hypothetical protein
MKTTEDIISKLNKMLEDDIFRINEFDKLIKQLKEEHNIKIKLLDFKYYNEYRRKLARKEKIKNIKIQEFETAANWRNLEKDCLSFISIRKEYDIGKSTFYYEQEYMFYFYLGNAKNDKKVRPYFIKK